MPRKRGNRRKIKRPPSPKLRLPRVNWGRIVNALTLVAVLFGSYNATLWLMDQPIRTVSVEGNFERVTPVQVEAAMRGYLDHGFVAVDIAELRGVIEDLPWVRAASVRRSWPASLQVLVEEEQAAARWGETGLVNKAGELFVKDATHIPAELPRLNGPKDSVKEVADRFFALQARLEQVGLAAVELEQDARGAWDMELSNGIRVRFGAMDLEVRVDRFFVALDQVLAPVAAQVDYVDMRYTNGFAIGWKEKGETRLADLKESDPHA
jgi:cell division protein FtsQ